MILKGFTRKLVSIEFLLRKILIHLENLKVDSIPIFLILLKKEILKWPQERFIYAIWDSPWVSSNYAVPKKHELWLGKVRTTKMQKK